MKILKIIATKIIGVYILLCITLFFMQKEMIFHPTSSVENNELTTMTINSDGESIEIITKKKGFKSAVIYFGGNGENVHKTSRDLTYNAIRHDMYFMSYRGYNSSTGYPSKENIYKDALFLYDKLSADYDSIYVIGRSIGTGPATFITSKRNVEKLILITPYTSIKSLASEMLPFLPIGILLTENFDNKENMANLNTDTLIIASRHDQVTPVEHAIELHSHIKSSRLIIVESESFDHNSIDSDIEFNMEILDMMNNQ